MFFTFPEDARWNADRQAVEFGVSIGEYEGCLRGFSEASRRSYVVHGADASAGSVRRFWPVSSEEITMAKRELIDTGTDKRYVRRDEKGRFKEIR
jgi:hypothetical protein